ncbi:unnamed protein product [Soboliphyme baturini]|uniref:DPPIV_N domain-containing protein n=1 Tax=Soboliphyme baturini TaxID=241478 RepID=A0A183J3M2_9BILA|nr:unnamed protein product [Soboliphyme baturini]
MARGTTFLLTLAALFFASSNGKESVSTEDTKQPFTISDIIPGNLSGVQSNFKWITENDFTYQDENGTIWLASINETDESQVLRWPLRGDDYDLANAYSISPSLDYICISIHQKQAFVYENDIFYQSSPTAQPIKLTNTGSKVVFNGVPDWVYEEEVLESDSAMWWSHSGGHLAYLTINDTRVQNISMTYYPEPPAVYPEIINISYPKVNTPIPEVRVNIWSRASNKTVPISPPKEVENLLDRYYANRLSWLKRSVRGEEFALITWANRVQNMGYFTVCSSRSGQCTISHKQNYTDYWVQPSECRIFPGDGDNIFLTLPKQQESGFFQHLANSLKFLTSGAWGVTEIVGFSKRLNRV